MLNDDPTIHKQFISFMVYNDFKQYCHDMFIWSACKYEFYIFNDDGSVHDDEQSTWEYEYLFTDYYNWVRTESRFGYMLKKLLELKQQICKLEGDDDEQIYYIKDYRTY
jgi:hypothetical protein